jgi:hypothetical protein
MALNKYSTSSRFSPKTTDPITKARIADPNKMGKVNPQGFSMVTSWPELRTAYQKGELPSNILEGAPKDIVSFMKGDTDILSERYAEPEYNINPDTQEIATYRSIGDPDSKTGDTYTYNDEDAGKRNVSWFRYDPDNRANRGMISRRRKAAGLFGDKLQDYIQGDSKGGAGSGYEMVGDYSEDELAGLYPDLQVGGGVGMSDFSQSVYRPSKKQIAEQKKRNPGPGPQPPRDEERIKKFIDEGPVRMKLRKAELPMGDKRSLVGDVERGEYSDPGMPGVRYVKGKKGKGKPKIARKQSRSAPISMRNKPDKGGSKGYFENLGERFKYNKEERLAKSTYGRGLEDMTGGELEARKDLLKSRKREQMSPFKRDDEGKITGVNRPQLFKNIAANQEARKEIRDINRAQKYSKMVGGPEAFSVSDRVNMGMLSKRQKESGPQYFKPERMQNFRSSKDNPLNRNSIAGFFNQNKTS